MQIGTLITILLWSNLSLSKYFKKENFKTGLTNVRATNKLQLKKLEREMGLKPGSSKATPGKLGNIGSLMDLIPLAKALEPEQLKELASMFLEGGFEGEEAQEGGGLLDNIPKSVIDSFIKGLTEGGGSGEEKAIESQV